MMMAAATSTHSQPAVARFAESLIELRRLRERLFDSALFADPAWDMMLHLFACVARSEDCTVSSLCDSAGVPTSTALRWIKSMEDSGLVMRCRDTRDARRVHVQLVPEARARMDELVAVAMASLGRAL